MQPRTLQGRRLRLIELAKDPNVKGSLSALQRSYADPGAVEDARKELEFILSEALSAGGKSERSSSHMAHALGNFAFRTIAENRQKESASLVGNRI